MSESTENKVHREFELLPSQKKHISFSELTTWIKCSYRYWLIYILNKRDEKPSYHADFGTAVHAAIEYYLRTRSTASVIFAIELLKFHWDINEQYEKLEPLKSVIEQAQILMAELPGWLEANFPGWQYVGAEELLYEDTGLPEHPHAFKGYVDCIIKTTDEKGKIKHWILDAKTSSFGWWGDKIRDENIQRQLVLYKHFWTTKNMMNLRDVGAAFMILKRNGKKEKSRIDLITISIGPKTVEKHLTVLNKSLTGIKRGYKWKNRYECDWCEFSNTNECKGYVFKK